MVDFDQEWRDFEDDPTTSRRRTGAPMTYTQYDQGLGTEVGQKSDLYKLGSKDKNKFFRLRKWQYRISTAIEKKEIGRTYRFITRELGITILPSNPADYIARFASSLKLSAETQSRSVEILEQAQKSER